MSVRARRDGDLASSPNEHSSCILPHYHTRKCTCPPHTHGHMQGARLTRLMQPRLALALEEDEPRHCRSLRRRCRAADARRRRRAVRERAAPLLEAQRDVLRHNTPEEAVGEARRADLSADATHAAAPTRTRAQLRWARHCRTRAARDRTCSCELNVSFSASSAARLLTCTHAHVCSPTRVHEAAYSVGPLPHQVVPRRRGRVRACSVGSV